MTFPVLGHFSYHLGSALISEGCSDIMFVLQSGGRFSMSDYLNHKKFSVLMTLACVGVGAWLSKGASVAKYGVTTAAETLAKVGLQVTVKQTSKSLAWAVLKKIFNELAKTTINFAKSKLIQSISSIFVKLVYSHFRDNLLSMIQNSHNYMKNMKQLRDSLIEMHFKSKPDEVRHVLEEQIQNAEHEVNLFKKKSELFYFLFNII